MRALLSRYRVRLGEVKALTASIAFVLLCLSFVDSRHLKELTIVYQGTSTAVQALPWKKLLPKDTNFILKGKIQVSDGSPRDLQITPDECVAQFTVNGREVFFPRIAEEQRCSSWSGFPIPVESLLVAGDNPFEITVEHDEGATGIDLNWLPDRCSASLMIGVLLILGLQVLSSRLKLSAPAMGAMILGIALRALYLAHTPPEIRTYDVFMEGGHFDYIKFIADRWALPPAGNGWEYHQPPLYYLLAAPFYAFARTFLSGGELFILQCFSLMLSLLFLVFGTRLIEAVLKPSFLRVLVLLVFCAWPAGVIHSIRIGNDALSTPLIAAAMFSLTNWFNSGSGRSLLRSAFIGGLAAFSKASGMVISPIFLFLFLWRRYFAGPLIASRRVLLTAIFLLGLGIFSSFASKLHSAFKENSDWLVGNVPATINPSLMVGNTSRNFICFVPTTFLNQPFTSSWSDELGRQCFWNFFLKSALFGEFTFASSNAAFIAICMSYLLLPMVIVLLFSTVASCIRRIDRALPHVLMILGSLALLLGFRIKMPYASNSDFRYILHILPACLCLANGIADSNARSLRVLQSLSCLLLLAFLGMSTAFFGYVAMSEL